jgi:predicted nucleic-acid-binding Zn-ribbon protein
VKAVVKCPVCGYEGEYKQLKTWRFRFYDVEMLECPKCRNAFNHYHGVSPTGRGSEFVVRIRPKPRASRGGK